jgi:DNA (cytosine-5)-methyltransferase 1
MYCIDLFAGAGGLSVGLEKAGFNCLYANEVSGSYSDTLKENHPESLVQTQDIRSVDAAKVRRTLQISRGDLHLLAGGPPCQGFSINAPIRSKGDERNHLFLEFLRFVDEFKPKAVLIENVPGMVSLEKGETVHAIISSLNEKGYDASVRILFAAHYGVPQMRWRTIILANRMGVPSLDMYPHPTHMAQGRANFTTSLDGVSLIFPQDIVEKVAAHEFVNVWEAISDLPEISNGGGEEVAFYTDKPNSSFQEFCRGAETELKNHVCARLGKINLERLQHIPLGGSWRDIPFDLLPKGMQRARRSDHTKRYGRLDPKGLGSTILTKCDPHWGTFVHPFQDRVLSVREAARIQSFPDAVKFFGSITEQYEQVGNAVPPLFAKSLGEQIRKVLFDSENEGTDLLKNPWRADQMQLPIDAERTLRNVG